MAIVRVVDLPRWVDRSEWLPSKRRFRNVIESNSFVSNNRSRWAAATHLRPAPKGAFAILPWAGFIHYYDPCDYGTVLKFMGGLGLFGE